MVGSVIQLKCKCNNYPWGKKGHESLAARLCSKSNPDFHIDDSMEYAEMWMGTYPELPSYSLETGEDLREILKHYKEKLVGKGALPLQIHPDKNLSEKLHQEHPDQFTDPNHKPEIAVALSRFEAFVGFKPLGDIQELIKLEILLPFLPTTSEGLTRSDDETLRQICTNMLKAEEGLVAKTMKGLLATPPQQFGQQAYVLELAKRLQEQYGKQDNGNLVALVCMNFLVLEAGSAIYIPADGIHAYLSGDIVECMARSNNVINAGFCPRADRDSVDLFASDKGQNGKTDEFKPPMSEFNLLVTKLSAGGKEEVGRIAGPSIMVVTNGHGKMSVDGREYELHEGSIFFVGNGVEVEMTAREELVVYRAYED
ncbi:mannose-6-phosphate isomerase, class I [Cladophialophora bantiana CBS 173.52]|uniref:Mannose-6-phosphate isomerase n=1 Tax=Cladophialophora bantiana (strain ATCC 10958 / CBS 173.52 / CDC B-1940 / NIH 8579) TaxID=1442370 RepID=A0A0D2HL66_CLAB1|nr:mannose-6-phosphate isomerase, class I [Cladophialophora bantiana CBS 173.52]KIW91480.1 mannose-6-phosphate isomerase, class I [Cladophialophora bantiana CBS 173.52]